MRAQEFLKLLAENNLFEINMGSKSLRRAVRNIDTLVGMEFEMAIPGSEEDLDSEEDMYHDTSAGDIDSIIEFFDDRDHNGAGDLRRLRDSLESEYQDWRQNQINNDWSNHGGYDFFVDHFERHYWEEDTALEDAVEDIRKANPDLPEDSQEFQTAVNNRVNEALQNAAEEAWSSRGRIYREAFDEYQEEQANDYTEEDWTDSEYSNMSDISSNFDITWPYWTATSQDTKVDIADIAVSFRRAVGRPVVHSERYHGADRLPDTYAIEPDSSIKVDNTDRDTGLEFISPPLPLKDALEDLAKVKKWADSVGAYTNDSTGLHMNISVPDMSTAKLDYVKLALLLGDERVLNEFGRLGNTYTESALKIVKDRIRSRPDQAEELLTQMRQNLGALATKAIHTGSTEKYTSINTQGNYIEFRSPGGDWLESNFSIIEPTLMRFVVALDAAMDPAKHRKEYLKKLYTVLAPQGKKDIVKYFAQYVAGELPKQALKSFIRQAQLERKIQKDPAGGEKYWWSVSRPGYFASIEVVAASKEEAISKALEPGNYPGWASARSMLQAKPLRPYQEDPKGPTLNGRPSNPDGNFIIVSTQNQSVPVYRYMASGGQDSLTVLRQWIAANPGQEWTFKQDAEQRLGQPGAATVPQGGGTGNWGVWVPSLDRFATIANAGVRRFESEADARAWIQDYNARRLRNNLGLVAREVGTTQSATAQHPEPSNWTILNAAGNPVGQVTARYQASAEEMARRQLLVQNPQINTSEFTVVPAASQQPAFQEPGTNRGNLTPRGPGPWEIYRISDGSRVRVLDRTNRQEAEAEARTSLGLRGEAPDLFGVRTRPAAQQSTAGNLGSFTGEWKIVDSQGRELHRFGGIGNVQADANRVALAWLQRNSRHMQAGVEVLPIMG